MSPQTLRLQLATLARRGYRGMTFAGAEQARREGTLPRRTLVVTFDDAYTSTLAALPILGELGWPATIFAVTSFATSRAPLTWPGIEQWLGGPYEHELEPLGWDGLRGLVDAGWEVGSHTVTHPRLTELADDALRAELESSRREIAERLGSCETIAYPYGAVDARVEAATRAAGYRAACTLPIALRPDEPLLRPRVGLYAADTGRRLWLKTAGLPLALRRSPAASLLRR